MQDYSNSALDKRTPSAIMSDVVNYIEAERRNKIRGLDEPRIIQFRDEKKLDLIMKMPIFKS